MAGYSIPTDKEIAEKTKVLINVHLTYHYSLVSLADECVVTTYTLKRIFKKICGYSIAESSLQARMDKANELLMTTNNTTQMIAEAVG